MLVYFFRSNDRTQSELDVAVGVIGKLPFFQQLPANRLEPMCKALEFCAMPAGRIGTLVELHY